VSIAKPGGKPMNRAEQIILGLQMLKNIGKVHVEAQHDVLYAMCELSEVPETAHNILMENGWHFDEENECYAFFT
jgi:hypothetical protein